jgi:hypothetical protein
MRMAFLQSVLIDLNHKLPKYINLAFESVGFFLENGPKYLKKEQIFINIISTLEIIGI